MTDDKFRSSAAFRAFIAIPMPDAVRERLGALQDRLRAAAADVKWVEPANIHLTLKFLGELSDEARPALDVGMKIIAASHAAFDLAVKGTGAFPAGGAPRVVWAGCHVASGKLVALAGAVEKAADAAGFAPEGRPFAAHVTVGRVKSSRNAPALRALLERESASDFGAFRVEAFVLYRSDLSPRGPTYTIVEHYAFGA